MPEKDSQRQYISFSEAAPLIFAEAVKRAKIMTNDPNATAADSFARALYFSKLEAMKMIAVPAGADFSFMSYLPYSAGGTLYGETLIYTFGFGTLTVKAGYRPGAFYYRMRPVYSSDFTISDVYKPARIYSPDLAFTFKNAPLVTSGVVTYPSVCTNTNDACNQLSYYVPGSYKWFYRVDNSPYMVACNEVSDCVQASISNRLYRLTYGLRTKGYDQFHQYWGAYSVSVFANCADSKEYALTYPGRDAVISCPFALIYDQKTPSSGDYFDVMTDEVPVFLSPFPIYCSSAKTYVEWSACDPRFAADVIAPESLAKLVDRIFYFGASRNEYRGFLYTPIVTADVINALGSRLVKVSSLADKIDLPGVGGMPPAGGSGGSGGSPSLDLGGDPATPLPVLEDAPTALVILAPVFDLFPSLRAYTVGSYSVQCPVFTPSIFGRVMTIDAHCTLAENQRVALGVVSLVAWACTALTIVLRS